jgi:hypothetical protein
VAGVPASTFEAQRILRMRFGYSGTKTYKIILFLKENIPSCHEENYKLIFNLYIKILV